jgi:hypothetical protein
MRCGTKLVHVLAVMIDQQGSPYQSHIAAKRRPFTAVPLELREAKNCEVRPSAMKRLADRRQSRADVRACVRRDETHRAVADGRELSLSSN